MEPETVIMLGDKVRLVGEIHYWIFEGWELRIPDGAVGTIVEWVGTKGCAVRFLHLNGGEAAARALVAALSQPAETGVAAEAAMLLKGIRDDLGFSEWATPEHAEAILSELISKYYPRLAALQGPGGGNNGS